MQFVTCYADNSGLGAECILKHSALGTALYTTLHSNTRLYTHVHEKRAL